MLNPGVIINDDVNLHIKNLKALPTVEEEVDKCIECGYCEHVCPSRNITTTPRRRIVIRRELQKLQLADENVKYKLLLKEYQYDGLETCAVDGLCATACPVSINTGDLVKRLRRENHSAFENKMALAVARNFKTVEFFVKTWLNIGYEINKVFGKRAMVRLTKGIRKIIPAFPLWSGQFGAAPVIPQNKLPRMQTQVVYFPACISRLMGRGVEGKKI